MLSYQSKTRLSVNIIVIIIYEEYRAKVLSLVHTYEEEHKLHITMNAFQWSIKVKGKRQVLLNWPRNHIDNSDNNTPRTHFKAEP